MIDIHCHILPKHDDGATDMDMTFDMINYSIADGIDTIIATPHYYSGVFENNFLDICESVNQLNEEIKRRNLQLQVLPGQEVMLSKNTVELYKVGRINGLNKSRYLLIELPFDELQDFGLDVIYELRVLGLVPVLAHPERYTYINQNIVSINQFIQEGCLFQINSHSLSGLFGKKVKHTAEELLENGICHFIASDAHSNRSRKPEISNALKNEKYFKNNVEFLRNLHNNGVRLINNEKIETNLPLLKEKKSIFQFLRK